eukprot:g45184.t1
MRQLGNLGSLGVQKSGKKQHNWRSNGWADLKAFLFLERNATALVWGRCIIIQPGTCVFFGGTVGCTTIREPKKPSRRPVAVNFNVLNSLSSCPRPVTLLRGHRNPPRNHANPSSEGSDELDESDESDESEESRAFKRRWQWTPPTLGTPDLR